MDRNGTAWCRENIDTITGWMRAEAEKRGAVFIESQARWLIELAIKLAEENREPTKLERLRLRVMRVGLRWLGGHQR